MGVPSAAIVYTGASGNMPGSNRGAAYSEGLGETLNIVNQGLEDIRSYEAERKKDQQAKMQAWQDFNMEDPDVWNVDLPKIQEKVTEYKEYMKKLKLNPKIDPRNLPLDEQKKVDEMVREIKRQTNAAKVNAKIWEKDKPPSCEYLIQSWDTAFEKNNRADYSACTTWGVFQHPDKLGNLKPHIILLDAMKARMEFPELKAKALELWKEWEPDTLIVEKRAAGAPLIYEMRKMGIPLSEFTPGKGNDKISRVNAISDLFASGVVWCPDTRWAEEVMDEMASVPNGDHDDLVDSSSQALMRFRQGGFITIDSDEPDEPIYQRRRMEYY
jgi:predicted phage terminase large subunit-like protein